MQPIRIGIVGAGAIAEHAHLPGYLKNAGAAIVAIADPVEANRTAAAKIVEDKTGEPVKTFASLTDLLAKASVDAVSIATPNTSHIDLAVEAVEAGKHVLLEKPMAVTNESAARLVEAAERSGKVVMIGQSHRYRNDVAALKRFVEAGQLGHIYHAEARMLRRRGTPTGWFTDKELAGGGPLMDIGVHALDLCWWMMGKPDPVRVSGNLIRGIGKDDVDFIGRWTSKMPHNQDNAIFTTEDFATAFIRFQDGATMSLTVSWELNGPDDDGLKVSLYGTAGGITLDPPVFYSTQHHVLTNTQIPVKPGPLYQNEFDHFIECVREGKTPRSPVADGHTVARMLVAIDESARSGHEVDVR